MTMDMEQRVLRSLRESPLDTMTDDVLTQTVCDDLPNGTPVTSTDISDVLLRLLKAGEIERVDEEGERLRVRDATTSVRGD